MTGPNVTIELFGMARARANCRELVVSATTAFEALGQLAEACPGLSALVLPDGTLARQFLLSLDGQFFVKDLGQPLKMGDRLVLLSADAGG